MSKEKLKEIFSFAFHNTKDIHSAMAAVNEWLVSPMAYAEFMATVFGRER